MAVASVRYIVADVDDAIEFYCGSLGFDEIMQRDIDDTRVKTRPVHSTLLRAGIPICEHMTNLGALPDSGFRFSAAPPKVKGMGTFPVRAYAVLG